MSSAQEPDAAPLTPVLVPIHPSDTKNFKEYQIGKSGISNLHFKTASPPAEFLVETSLYSPNKPDLVLHEGSSSSGKLLGEVDLKNFSGHYTVKLLDANGETVTLEELDRVKGYSSRHQFELAFGSRERETFVWRHPGVKITENRDDLELIREEEDEEDVVMAQYQRGHGWKAKGTLVIRQGGGEKWELMIVLTLAALIITRRREQ